MESRMDFRVFNCNFVVDDQPNWADAYYSTGHAVALTQIDGAVHEHSPRQLDAVSFRH
jgi:hypothetical protein